MRFSFRILLGMLLPVALLTAGAFHLLHLTRSLHRENRELVGVNLQTRRLGLEIDHQLVVLDRYHRVFLIRQDVDYVGELRRQRQGIQEQLDTLQSVELSPPEQAQMGAVAAAWSDYRSAAEGIEDDTLAGRSISPSRIEDVQAAWQRLREELAALDDVVLTAVDRRLQESGSRVDRGLEVAVATATVSLILGLAAAVVIAGGLSRRLRNLAAGTHEVAAGNFEFRVRPRGSSELRELARDFNWMAEHLGELEHLKRDFVSSVSHDLKAPLASMQETTRLLLDQTPGSLNERQRKLLELNLQCNDRLTAMIVDLLDLAQLEAGGLQFDRQDVDLRELAGQALGEIEGLAMVAEVDLKRSFGDTPAMVEADQRWLLRAIWNLLSNALRHSPPGRSIDVQVSDCGDDAALRRRSPGAPPSVPLPAVLLAVRDQGPGVNEDERLLIFDRFYRGRHARRDGRGTGLGLAISREIVHRHGGEIWLEPGIRDGSLFCIALPAASADRSRPADA